MSTFLHPSTCNSPSLPYFISKAPITLQHAVPLIIMFVMMFVPPLREKFSSPEESMGSRKRGADV